MILYSTGGDRCLGVEILKVRGSVLPQAIGWATAFSLVSLTLQLLPYAGLDEDQSGKVDFLENLAVDGTSTIWAAYSSILGFLVVFRNNQAYARFWEGASLARQIRGEWFNAASALVAFSSHHVKGPEDKLSQNRFKHIIVRLFSALYCSALQQVCDLDESCLQVLDLNVMTPHSLAQLEDVDDRCQLIILWLQRLIIRANMKEVVYVPSPILSRVFQELSRGVVHLTNLRKLKEVPFPFPYQQTLLFMLYAHNMMTAVLSVALLDSTLWSFFLTFMVVLSFWSVIFIAVEIDQPFGDDANDLPLVSMQQEFNNSLGALLQSSGLPCPDLIDSTGIKRLRRSIKLHSVTDLKDVIIPADFVDDDDEGSDIEGELLTKKEGVDDDDEDELKVDRRVSIDSGPTELPDSERFRAARLSEVLSDQVQESDYEEDRPQADGLEGFYRAISAPESPMHRVPFPAILRLSTSSDHLGSQTNLQKKKDGGKMSQAWGTKMLTTSCTEPTARSDLAAAFKNAKQSLHQQQERSLVRTISASESAPQTEGRTIIKM